MTFIKRGWICLRAPRLTPDGRLRSRKVYVHATKEHHVFVNVAFVVAEGACSRRDIGIIKGRQPCMIRELSVQDATVGPEVRVLRV